MAVFDENLNVIFPVITERITKKIKGEDGKEKDIHEDIVRVHAFHAPISKPVFDLNFRILAATKSALASRGAHYLMSSGPRIATLTLRDEGLRDAESRGRFDDDGKPKDDETRAFLAELKRLTTILCPGVNGWDMLPVDTAIATGKIDEEDWQETEASIVFFTCQRSMSKKVDRERIAKATASLLNASITSSPLSEYVASLQKSTLAHTSAPRVASSDPS